MDVGPTGEVEEDLGIFGRVVGDEGAVSDAVDEYACDFRRVSPTGSEPTTLPFPSSGVTPTRVVNFMPDAAPVPT